MDAGGDVTVKAIDDTQIITFAGALAASLEGTGVGIGLDVTGADQDDRSRIEASNNALAPTTVNAGGNVVVDAHSSEDLFSLTLNVGAGDSTSAAGGAIVAVFDTTTRAFVGQDPDAPSAGNLVLSADGSLAVAADSSTEAELYAGTLGISLSGSSIGISVGVLVDLDTTNAFIGDGADVTALGNGTAISVRDGVFDDNGNQGTENVRGVAVTATSYEDATVLGIGASGIAGLRQQRQLELELRRRHQGGHRHVGRRRGHEGRDQGLHRLRRERQRGQHRCPHRPGHPDARVRRHPAGQHRRRPRGHDQRRRGHYRRGVRQRGR